MAVSSDSTAVSSNLNNLHNLLDLLDLHDLHNSMFPHVTTTANALYLQCSPTIHYIPDTAAVSVYVAFTAPYRTAQDCALALRLLRLVRRWAQCCPFTNVINVLGKEEDL